MYTLTPHQGGEGSYVVTSKDAESLLSIRLDLHGRAVVLKIVVKYL